MPPSTHRLLGIGQEEWAGVKHPVSADSALAGAPSAPWVTPLEEGTEPWTRVLLGMGPCLSGTGLPAAGQRRGPGPLSLAWLHQAPHSCLQGRTWGSVGAGPQGP